MTPKTQAQELSIDIQQLSDHLADCTGQSAEADWHQMLKGCLRRCSFSSRAPTAIRSISCTGARNSPARSIIFTDLGKHERWQR